MYRNPLSPSGDESFRFLETRFFERARDSRNRAGESDSEAAIGAGEDKEVIVTSLYLIYAIFIEYFRARFPQFYVDPILRAGFEL